MSQLIKPENFDKSKLSLSSVRTYGNQGGKLIYINYDEKKNVDLITPSIRFPFGVNKFESDNGGCKYDLTLSLDNMEDASIKSFYTCIKQVDEFIKEEARKNSLTWFKKRDASEEVINALFTDSIKQKDNYSPVIKTKITEYNNEFKIAVYDDKANTLYPNEQNDSSAFLNKIKKNGRGVAIISPSVVWISNNRFGITWKLTQLKVNTVVDQSTYSFLDEDSD